jgi:hypothetical protein
MMLRCKGLIVLVRGDVLNSTVIDGKKVGNIQESLASLRLKKGEKSACHIYDPEDNSEQLLHGLAIVLGHLWSTVLTLPFGQ